MSDPYEAEYMAGEGAVLHRQKASLPAWLVGMLGGVTASVAAGLSIGLSTAGLISTMPALAILGGGLALGGLTGGLILVSSVARIMVSERLLVVQMGPGDLRVPTADIVSVTIGPSGSRVRGLGYKALVGGARIYNMLGDPARAVRLEVRGERGPLAIVCEDPEALAEALEQARAATRVRVEGGALAEPEAEALGEPAGAEADVETATH